MLSFLSLEPVVFLVQFGRYALEGAQIQTDLLMWKICHLEKNYSESICSNLTLDEYDDINTMVQTRANNLLMVMQWLHSGRDHPYIISLMGLGGWGQKNGNFY